MSYAVVLGRLSTRRAHKRSLREKAVSPRRASRNMSLSFDCSSFTVKDTCCGASASSASTTSPSSKPSSVCCCKTIHKTEGTKAEVEIGKHEHSYRSPMFVCGARSRGGRGGERRTRCLLAAKRFYSHYLHVNWGLVMRKLHGVGGDQLLLIGQP